MELAKPTFEDAVQRCLERGAWRIVVVPFFLGPGRHMSKDIPYLIRKISYTHPDIEWNLAEPLGAHPLLVKVLTERFQAAALD